MITKKQLIIFAVVAIALFAIWQFVLKKPEAVKEPEAKKEEEKKA